jgi:L-ascorbate oxidase
MKPQSALILFGITTLLATIAPAQTPRAFVEPATLPTVRVPHGVQFDLKVGFATLPAYNPGTGKTDLARLRTYNGKAVGPTIHMRPGDILSGTVHNNLPKDPAPCDPKGHEFNPNIPNCFNITNLHTHGFHVSPSGKSDNVLLEILPTEKQDYEFKLPKDHPAGTFWYHSHRHGSTALQVSSGMEGALIVEGTRTYATRQAHGGLADIDTVLKQSPTKKAIEHLALFQQIQYSCRTPDGAFTWDCSTRDPSPTGPKQRIGGIDDYTSGQFGPSSWEASGRYTSINGVVQPSIDAVAGQLYRFRLIHGGVRDTIGLHITLSSITNRANLLASTAGKGITAANEPDWTKQNCQMNQPVPQFEFAADGLTRTSMSEKVVNVLQPGYRSDVLTVFPQAGVYCVTDDVLDPTSEINDRALTPGLVGAAAFIPKERRLLALIYVTGPTKLDPTTLRKYLGDQLYKGNPELPADVRDRLRNLDIAAFSPMPDLTHETNVGHQDTEFFIQLPDGPKKLEFWVNGRPYKHDRIDKTLKLGAVDEWDISSGFDGHPYHIHVNAFQILAITNKAGQSIIDSSGHCTELDGSSPDPQYCDQIGVFRDTIFVKEGYHITTRTKYEDFAGDFVLHCHILDHEDQGMMQNIRIEDPLHPNPSPFGGDTMHMQH